MEFTMCNKFPEYAHMLLQLARQQ